MSAANGRIEYVTPADLLAFEARWPHHTSAKGERIRSELGITPVRFYQLLHRFVMTREALEADPLTARRVRDQLHAAQERRSRRAAPRVAAYLS